LRLEILLGVKWLDDAPFLLALLRENDESEKLVVKASCDLQHDIIVVSKDIFIQEEYSLKKTPLEKPCDKEVIEVKPRDWELIDPISIKCSPKSLPTYIVLPLSSFFHSSMDPLMFTSIKFETCMLYALNLDRTHEVDVTIGLED